MDCTYDKLRQILYVKLRSKSPKRKVNISNYISQFLVALCFSLSEWTPNDELFDIDKSPVTDPPALTVSNQISTSHGVASKSHGFPTEEQTSNKFEKGSKTLQLYEQKSLIFEQI